MTFFGRWLDGKRIHLLQRWKRSENLQRLRLAVRLHSCTHLVYRQWYTSHFVAGSSKLTLKAKVVAEDLKQLEAYGRNLLRDAPQLHGNGRSVTSDGSSESDEYGGERYGCREAVEVLTRNPKKGETCNLSMPGY